ncbi:MAG: excinuclease ABC subunit UvrC [Gammaproteobacteria bacterium]|nr:excinuclease ABC subunit UvrC [Gammaproteobacteria bacterium]NNJ50885.1 excinuclease ABC subunit UvrC [Gammaproteobacteria bacterium]
MTSAENAAGEEPSAEPVFDSAAFLKNVTSKPGVYRMLDEKEQVIYVGKAKNLKNRLSSYFRQTGLSPKTRVMVSKINDINITITHTEGEALLLESNLIKELRPRYNVLMRDDKSYPYIFISDKSAYPRIAMHRGARKKKGLYLGPYPNAHAVRESINLLQKMFLIRQCEDTTFANRSRPCLQYQIKRCTAPCVGYISEKAYRKDIDHAVLFLQGKSEQIITELVKDMEKAADKHHFEKAALYRDQISNLRKVTEKQHISADKGDIDVIACSTQAGQACVQVFYVRNGLNLGNRSFYPSLPEEMNSGQILTAFIPQFYLKRDVPGEIIVSDELEDRKLIEEVLSEQSKHRVKLTSKVRGERAKWIEMALSNANNSLKTRLISRSGLLSRFEALQEVLQLDEIPVRLECFDISHTQGESTVASCVVFTPEGAFKTDYRRYNITGITGGDDYAAMKQALQRRFRPSKSKDQKLPDILFIDGGKGQLKQAIEVFEQLEIESVLLIGVAKGEGRKAGLEKLIFSDGRPDLYLTIESAALNLILQVRDEAHRFAISGHRAQRAKKRRTSPLEGISGLGPKRRQTLLKHFGGIQGITQAGIEDIAKIPGISKKLAQEIYGQFHATD